MQISNNNIPSINTYKVGFADITDEITLLVLKLLSPKDLSQMSLVNKRFYHCANDTSLWKKLGAQNDSSLPFFKYNLLTGAFFSKQPTSQSIPFTGSVIAMELIGDKLAIVNAFDCNTIELYDADSLEKVAELKSNKGRITALKRWENKLVSSEFSNGQNVINVWDFDKEDLREANIVKSYQINDHLAVQKIFITNSAIFVLLAEKSSQFKLLKLDTETGHSTNLLKGIDVTYIKKIGNILILSAYEAQVSPKISWIFDLNSEKKPIRLGLNEGINHAIIVDNILFVELFKKIKTIHLVTGEILDSGMDLGLFSYPTKLKGSIQSSTKDKKTPKNSLAFTTDTHLQFIHVDGTPKIKFDKIVRIPGNPLVYAPKLKKAKIIGNKIITLITASFIFSEQPTGFLTICDGQKYRRMHSLKFTCPDYINNQKFKMKSDGGRVIIIGGGGLTLFNFIPKRTLTSVKPLNLHEWECIKS